MSDSVVAGANIFQVAAEDPDSGDFGEIRYEFDTNSNSKQITNLFMINSKSGKIFTLEGMRELDKRYIALWLNK